MQNYPVFDFRSDTVTRPDLGMRKAMYEAEVGDDVYGDDKTVINLENSTAELLGKEAGLFVSSGTQSNLIAILCHAGRGEEFITGSTYHSHYYEAGGAAVLGGVVPCGLPVGDDGQILTKDIIAAIKPDDPHFPITRLICLENTVCGRVQPSNYLASICNLAAEKGLFSHLDGARLLNASVATGQLASDIVRPFDSVSLCLSKGLGAPVGSVLVGKSEFIAKARRLRKMLGGGMRQVGILAAAGLYALEHNIDRLAEDHRHAREIAIALGDCEGITINRDTVETNMIYMHLHTSKKDRLASFLADKNIILSPSDKVFRIVVHKDITPAAVGVLIETIRTYMAS